MGWMFARFPCHVTCLWSPSCAPALVHDGVHVDASGLSLQLGTAVQELLDTHLTGPSWHGSLGRPSGPFILMALSNPHHHCLTVITPGFMMGFREGRVWFLMLCERPRPTHHHRASGRFGAHSPRRTRAPRLLQPFWQQMSDSRMPSTQVVAPFEAGFTYG